VPTYEQEDNTLRFALMDKEGSGKNVEQQKEDIAEIRKIKNAVVAVGQNITMNEFDRWLKEISGVSAEWVRWVHTKFMLVDPLSDDPIVITGSANFSAASVKTNHENMLVTRGDKRVADIYLGEFMRQFTSYAFRDAAHEDTHGENAENWRPQDLLTDASWIGRYQTPGTSGMLRRLYFSGQ
jgi:phosphatidylserine/phosphatidylglycerophosphate/cardiolipin synthase-like enzyme